MVSGAQGDAILRQIEACDAKGAPHLLRPHWRLHAAGLAGENGATIVSFHGADAGVDLDKPRHRRAMTRSLNTPTRFSRAPNLSSVS